MTAGDERASTSRTASDSADLMDDRRCRAMAKGTGERCKRYAIPGGRVCVIHGGASPQARAAAARRRADAEAMAVLEVIWDPAAEPVTNPVEALQGLAGRLQHAANVLGARVDSRELDGPTGLAWARVIRELRLALEGMERLDLAGKHVEIEAAKVEVLVAGVRAGMDALGLLPDQRNVFIRVLLTTIGAKLPGDDVVITGELG